MVQPGSAVWTGRVQSMSVDRLTAEQIEELERLVGLLATQDNAITSDPVYTVQRRHLANRDPDYTERVMWYGSETEESVTAESDADRFARFENGEFDQDADGEAEMWSRTGYEIEWRHDQSFLTRAAAETYRAIEAHNIGESRVYVDSGHRNTEWKWLRSALPALLLAARRDLSHSAELAERDARIRVLEAVVTAAENLIASKGNQQARTPLHDALAAYYRVVAGKLPPAPAAPTCPVCKGVTRIPSAHPESVTGIPGLHSERCPACHGTGKPPPSGPADCVKCGGAGNITVPGPFAGVSEVFQCPDCGGRSGRKQCLPF